jgi:hypothetical protein
MINVPRAEEPPEFDARCRQPGTAWLNAHQPQPNGKQPRPTGNDCYWNLFRADVESEFCSRCGYYAMYIHDGEIDHFVPWNQNHQFGFEWTNLRFIDARLNKRKGAAPLLDPFNVQDGWFEVKIPSLVLFITSALTDPTIRRLAENTVERLDLKRGRKALQMRAVAYEDYRRNDDITMLERKAPLVARAVDIWRRRYPGKPLPDCSVLLPRHLR